LDEGASIRIDATGVVEENVVYALHVGAMEGDAAYVASALVVLRHGQCDILDRSGS
jgi:hypothetical protein